MLRHLRYLFVLPLLFSIGCSCDDQLSLEEVCPTPTYCYVEDGIIHEVDSYKDFTGNYNVGPNSACQLGFTTCDPKTKQVSCEGHIRRSFGTKELCNSIDDNCDFRVDEYTTRLSWDSSNTCQNNAGSCIQRQKCIDGQFYCQAYYPGECKEEICDKLDNDGDGLVDEDTEEEPLYDEPYTYQGTPETDLVGECRPGRKQCIDGVTHVIGQVLPTFEQCGDNKDNDCDGFVDESENPSSGAAYALVLDVSGSMSGYLGSATNAVCNFSQNSLLGNSEFAVVLVGYSHPGAENQVIIGLDFTDSQSLCDYLLLASWGGNGGWELQIEGALVTHRSDFPIAIDPTSWQTHPGLSWPEGLDKRVIIFTDEDIQTLEGQSVSTLVYDCLTHGYEIGVFTHFQNSWSYPVSQCGGFVDALYSEDWIMEQQMLGHLSGGC